MTELAWETPERAAPSDLAVVDRGLDEHNRAAADLAAVQPLVCLARAKDGSVAGGAVGRRWGAAAELQQLWVRPDLRSQGVGAELVRRFEAEARRHGCLSVYLDTFSFQAPGFYQRQGYALACELKGFPSGATKRVMTKQL